MRTKISGAAFVAVMALSLGAVVLQRQTSAQTPAPAVQTPAPADNSGGFDIALLNKKVKIVSAKWSINGKVVDVTAEVKSGQTLLPGSPVHSGTFNSVADPSVGDPKDLVVAYVNVNDGSQKTVTLYSDDVLLMQGVSRRGTPAPQLDKKFAIIKAYYGQAATWIDATKPVSDFVKSADAAYEFHHETFSPTGADPAVGIGKRCAVVWSENGMLYFSVIPQDWKGTLRESR